MTSEEYNKKMHDYALEYNIDEKLKQAGKKTRFKKDMILDMKDLL